MNARQFDVKAIHSNTREIMSVSLASLFRIQTGQPSYNSHCWALSGLCRATIVNAVISQATHWTASGGEGTNLGARLGAGAGFEHWENMKLDRLDDLRVFVSNGAARSMKLRCATPCFAMSCINHAYGFSFFIVGAAPGLPTAGSVQSGDGHARRNGGHIIWHYLGSA